MRMIITIIPLRKVAIINVMMIIMFVISANRTILTLADFLKAHLKASAEGLPILHRLWAGLWSVGPSYEKTSWSSSVPKFQKHMWKFSTPLKFWTPANSEVSIFVLSFIYHQPQGAPINLSPFPRCTEGMFFSPAIWSLLIMQPRETTFFLGHLSPRCTLANKKNVNEDFDEIFTQFFLFLDVIFPVSFPNNPTIFFGDILLRGHDRVLKLGQFVVSI